MKEELLGGYIKEFITSFRASLDPRMYLDLIKEENKELQIALKQKDRTKVLKEMTDLLYVQISFNHVVTGAHTLGLIHDDEVAEMTKVIEESDATYTEALAFMGAETNLFEAFRRIHFSNMSKLMPDGTAQKNKKGKVQKGPNYKEPNLSDLI